MLATEATGWIQLEGKRNSGYWIKPGFSGAPIWDEQLNGVVGLAIAVEADHAIRAAFMIPVFKLIQTWPYLASKSFPERSLEYLRYQLELYEVAQNAAEDPHRFQLRIGELREALAGWDGRVKRQEQRITQGLDRERDQKNHVWQQTEQTLKTVGQPPLNVTHYFKDRAEEMTTLLKFLAEPNTRLVSIIGHGGIGKTALACRTLEHLVRQGPPCIEDNTPLTGIVYLSTHTCGITLEQLFHSCAKLLHEEEEKRLIKVWIDPQLDQDTKILHLLEVLGSGKYVILLDNLEDLFTPSGELADQGLNSFFEKSLTTTDGLKLLITSRVALDFRHALLRFDRRLNLQEGLPVDAGVALLREMDPNGEWGLRDASQEKLVRAVEVTHGVPRALEVVAGILAHDPFASLDTLLTRFYTQEEVVRELIEENYRRMSRKARQVLDALAVFHRPVPVVAIDYLLQPFAPGLNVPDLVGRLVKTNIVSVDRNSGMIGLHPIDQDYCYNQLPESEDVEGVYSRRALEHRAADYYAQIHRPREEWQNLDDLQPQLLEFEHRVRAEEYDAAYQLTEPISFNCLFQWGYYAKLADLWERLIGRIESPQLRTAHLGHLGIVYRVIGRIKDAIEVTKRALALAEKIGDSHWQSAWLGNLGIIRRHLGDPLGAKGLFREALEKSQNTSHRHDEAQCFISLAYAHFDLGELSEAVHLYEQGMEIAYALGSIREGDLRIVQLGKLFLAQGNIDRAVGCFRQALEVQLPHTAFRAKLGLGIAQLWLQDPAAGGTFEDAVQLCHDVLEQMVGAHKPHYALGTALIGQAVCDPSWMDEGKRHRLLMPALKVYKRALNMCEAPGVIQTVVRDLRLMTDAGVNGLEPAYLLLENAKEDAMVRFKVLLRSRWRL
jgi:tetratricopeptide (TPR) repeat protein